MTKEQYSKWSLPFRKRQNGKKILAGMDRFITALVFFSYPGLLFYLFYTEHFAKLFACILVPAASFLFVSCFRTVYSAPRPYEVLEIQPLLQKETKGKSFPSRHVFSIFMIGMTFFSVSKPLGIGIGVLGIALSYIRVVGGVHFPKDVAAGAFLGILFGLPYFIR